MNRLQQAWAVLIGQFDIEQLCNAIAHWRHECSRHEQRIFELEREGDLARAGIRDLRAKFEQLGGEAKIKAASDAVGNSIIDDMKANPSKYIPKAK